MGENNNLLQHQLKSFIFKVSDPDCLAKVVSKSFT